MAKSFKTGQIALSSGVRATLGATVLNNDVVLKGHPSNTVAVWLGESTVVSGTGYPLAANQELELEQVGNLDDLYAITYAAGQRLCWATTIKE